MKYVQRIEDSEMWREQFEDEMKGKSNMQGAYYVVNQAGKGDNVQFIPPVAQDIQMAKAKIVKYKRKRKRVRKQSKPKRRVRKKVKKKPSKRKTIKKRKKSKRK